MLHHLKKYLSKVVITLTLLMFVATCAIISDAVPVHAAEANAPWWPIQVRSYYGHYDAAKKVPGQAATSLKGPTLEEWTPPLKANKPYRIGVSFPHLKDSYWQAVNYGIIQEAKRLGVGIKLMESGGYGELETQIKQVNTLRRDGMDGIILGAISYEGNDGIVAVTQDRGVPVIEVINDVHAPSISAKALVSFYDMGFYAGKFVAEKAEKDGLKKLTVSFLPGPKDSGWAPDSLEGFQDAVTIFPGSVDIVDVTWGDTGTTVQSELIRNTLAEHPNLNYLVGNAVAAQVAPEILTSLGRNKNVTVVSTYIIPPLYDLIKKGSVAAAPSDLTVFQGRMAVDMIVRLLNGEKPGQHFPFRSGPFIPVITRGNINDYPFETLFGPRDYNPVLNLQPAK